MKKKIICLMIACLSLFAYPGLLNAGATAAVNPENTETVMPPHLSPAMEKKVNEFKKHHPGLLRKDKKAADASEGMKRDGGVIIISGGALLIIIILLILLL